ncbi:DinB family protein [Geothrix sp. PMB-07]|uniref:DinB family protein n=1 Tax=Geothrix sp. PMB-07 TaxID=3068640 RepID=UPI00274270DD|nr:DinB family protein [Geothrix sp. PMB-07]WLT32884.1 DinB family protein [Geothrix sp. PMB-07]
MAHVAEWLKEFDLEMSRTRKVLARVPEDRLGWRPHPKSWTLAELATHLAWIPSWVTPSLRFPDMDLASPDSPAMPKAVTSATDLLALFDGQQIGARASLEASDESTFSLPWSLRAGEQVFFTQTRGEVLRTFVMNHLIHHRGQLEVYLRVNDVPLPALYGPSADEGGM